MNKAAKALIAVFVMIGCGLVGYRWIKQWHGGKIDQVLQQEQTKCKQEISQLQAEVNLLGTEMEKLRDKQPSAAELTEIFGPMEPTVPMPGKTVDCGRINSQAASFFQYIHNKAADIQPDLKISYQDLTASIFKDLCDHPPINVGETEDIHRLISNATHFYRVLGKERLQFLIKITKSEADILEPALAVLFARQTACDSDSKPPQLSCLYSHACFLLNSLGGRSYLLRREARLRILIQYYALLVVDLSNDVEQNFLGLDLRPHLNALVLDIQTQRGLMYREQYLAGLNALKVKYGVATDQ